MGNSKPKISPARHACRECNLRYADERWAEKCEKWCRAHHSCNLAITTHAIK